MENDEKVQEVYDELKKREEQKQSSVLRKLPQNTKLIFLGSIGILAWAIYTNKIESKAGVFIGLVIGAIIYFSTIDDENFTKVLSEQECRIKLSEQLRYKQLYPLGGHYQIDPKIKITHLPHSKLRRLEGKPWKWMLGLRFFDPETHLSTLYAGICNPYSGDLQGFKELKGGVDDMEVDDITMIPDYKMNAEKRYHDYMGKWQDRK